MRIQLYPDPQRMFICTDPSVMRMMKSHDVTGSLVRKLYSTCRCISELLVNQNPVIEIRSISYHDFLVNQNPKLCPDRFRGLVKQNPKSSDVAELPVQEGFSGSSLSVQKKRRCFYFLVLFV